MKKIFCLLFLYLLIFYQCIDKKTLKKSKTAQTTVSTVSEENIIDINPEELIGIWGLIEDENAAFEISKDSIYYVDAGENVFYTVKKDTIFIFLEPNYIDTSIYEIRGDKLILKWKDLSDTLVRFYK